jgi:hypothetical protein
MHDPAVALGEYCPVLHAVQPEDPRGENFPVPQLAQSLSDVAPVDA